MVVLKCHIPTWGFIFELAMARGDRWLDVVPLVVRVGDGSRKVVLCLRDLGSAMT